MKYETLKENVARDVYAAIAHGRAPHSNPSLSMEACAAVMFDAIAERRPFDVSRKALAEKCLAIVLAWDVRMVGKLRELFPDSFPRNLKTGVMVCDYDDAGDWIVTQRAA